MDAVTVAQELYALRPGEFVAARNAKVAEARAAGDRELATEIKAMRRPTVSAWVTNLFAHEQGERIEQLFALGVALREAQTALSADKLRRLGAQRRQVITALASEAAALAAKRGQTVGPQIVADVEQTHTTGGERRNAAADMVGQPVIAGRPRPDGRCRPRGERHRRWISDRRSSAGELHHHRHGQRVASQHGEHHHRLRDRLGACPRNGF